MHHRHLRQRLGSAEADRLHVDRGPGRPHPNLTDVFARPRLRPSGEWTGPSQRSQIQTIETSGAIFLLLIRLSKKSNARPGGSGRLAPGVAFMCRRGANRSVATAVATLLMGNAPRGNGGYELQTARLVQMPPGSVDVRAAFQMASSSPRPRRRRWNDVVCVSSDAPLEPGGVRVQQAIEHVQSVRPLADFYAEPPDNRRDVLPYDKACRSWKGRFEISVRASGEVGGGSKIARRTPWRSRLISDRTPLRHRPWVESTIPSPRSSGCDGRRSAQRSRTCSTACRPRSALTSRRSSHGSSTWWSSVGEARLGGLL